VRKTPSMSVMGIYRQSRRLPTDSGRSDKTSPFADDPPVTTGNPLSAQRGCAHRNVFDSWVSPGIYHAGEGGRLERSVWKDECPPHVRDGAIVVPEPFLRLFEVTTDDVDERIYRDLHGRIESVEVVHGDHARVHI
jgi:hypothetical protein